MGKFIEILDENYKFWQEIECPPESKMEYVGNMIFVVDASSARANLYNDDFINDMTTFSIRFKKNLINHT
jgi:hypothetical protein